jgi:ligand-binding sensor domain-containing protein
MTKIFREMTICKLKNSILCLLLASLLFTSCSGQISTIQTTNSLNSSNKKKQHPKIVRTLGTKFENVNCQLLDKDGNLWFSIRGEGVYLYDGKSFINFTTEDGLCNNNVGSIIQDRAGNILIGTRNGICKYDANKFTKYPVPDTLSITSMFEDKDGNLWFGAMNKGIYRYDGNNVSNFLFKYEHPFFGEKYEKYISDIIQDRNGNLWFSSWNGGAVWRYDGKEFKNFLPSSDYYKSNQDNRRTDNAENSLNFILKNNSFIPSQDHITDDMIFSMTEDNLGNIWFATRDHGICYYNGKTFTSIGKNEGLGSQGVTAILQDDQYNFWISTFDSGVWYYDGKTFKNFTENDGLVNNAVMSVLKDKNGNLWFGTKGFGLSRYDGKTFTTFSQYEN